jgi:hypothetical protein
MPSLCDVERETAGGFPDDDDDDESSDDDFCQRSNPISSVALARNHSCTTVGAVVPPVPPKKYRMRQIYRHDNF